MTGFGGDEVEPWFACVVELAEGARWRVVRDVESGASVAHRFGHDSPHLDVGRRVVGARVSTEDPHADRRVIAERLHQLLAIVVGVASVNRAAHAIGNRVPGVGSTPGQVQVLPGRDQADLAAVVVCSVEDLVDVGDVFSGEHHISLSVLTRYASPSIEGMLIGCGRVVDDAGPSPSETVLLKRREVLVGLLWTGQHQHLPSGVVYRHARASVGGDEL